MPAQQVEEIVLTWRSTIDFFKELRLQYQSVHRNTLLINEFLSFCEFHFIGEKTSEVTPERIINRYDANGFLKELNTFASSLPSAGVVTKADSIDYTVGHLSRGCFFTIWFARDLIVLKPKNLMNNSR
ncbi:hypothetical protein [Paenibacillus sp. LPE1-1-1.1]|uniref:hypothetical protein n=1 Tax=Paenibacillus sp. LPE1-1-1.1 TaxID=3135230 RepID=UPI00341F2F02